MFTLLGIIAACALGSFLVVNGLGLLIFQYQLTGIVDKSVLLVSALFIILGTYILYYCYDNAPIKLVLTQ